ncbi:MAG: hypothetical protein FWC11_02625 [Firmicutes bacterium]|nr:hypothetical protein [Bacillota bacterium]MCL2255734.1 hypothetical protein [Bacillota bacterium]
MRSIFDIMSDSDTLILEFDRACDNLILSKYILADKRISDLLKVVASSKKLYSLIKGVLKGFDFVEEYKLATIRRGQFFLPKSRKKLISFVFCLLYYIDTNAIELSDFLKDNFSSSNVNLEFSNFTSQVILPFRHAVGREFLGEPEEKSTREEFEILTGSGIKIEEKMFLDQSLAPKTELFVDSAYEIEPATSEIPAQNIPKTQNQRLTHEHLVHFESLYLYSQDILAMVSSSNSINLAEKNTLLLELKKFENAIKMQEIGEISIAYKALRSALIWSGFNEQFSKQLSEIDHIVRELH